MPTKKTFHLHWSLKKQEWEIKEENSEDILFKSLMKSEAIRKGRALAKSLQAKLLIHNKYSEFDDVSSKLSKTNIKK